MRNQGKNHPPTNSIVRYYRYIVRTQNLILAISFLFMLDFHWLPTKTIQDQGIYASRHESQGVYKTKKGLTFGTWEHYYPELGVDELEISYTPLFNSVKTVKTSQNDYTYRLGSDMHQPSNYIVYFVTFFVLCSRIALMKIQEPNEDTLWKILISGAVILGSCWYVWSLVN